MAETAACSPATAEPAGWAAALPWAGTALDPGGSTEGTGSRALVWFEAAVCVEDIQDMARVCRFCGARRVGLDWSAPGQPPGVRKNNFTIASTGWLLMLSGALSPTAGARTRRQDHLRRQ
jgi:hypothetical protein